MCTFQTKLIVVVGSPSGEPTVGCGSAKKRVNSTPGPSFVLLVHDVSLYLFAGATRALRASLPHGVSPQSMIDLTALPRKLESGGMAKIQTAMMTCT